MNRIIRIVVALACVTAAGRLAHAADNGTEFGVEDDLTVLGTEGTAVDPDMEVKGFTVFGTTQAAPVLYIPVAAGNIFANGYVQVSSGLYVAGSSTFTAAVHLPAPGSIAVVGGSAGQVMSKSADGYMQWADVSSMVSGDNLGNHVATTTLNMANFNISAANYVMASSAALSGQLVVYGTSTLTGNTGVGGDFGAAGNVSLGDAAGDAITAVGAVTAQNGVAVTGGDVSVTNNLTVNGNAQLGNAVGDTHSINRAAEAGVALAVDSGGASGNYAAKFYSGGSLAAWIKKK